MTLVGVKIDNSITRQSGPYCFKIQGELHYLTGALLPHGGQTPMYAQIYILDTAEQLNVRRANNNNLDPVVMDNLQTIPSFPLTTTMVKSNIQNKSFATNARPSSP